MVRSMLRRARRRSARSFCFLARIMFSTESIPRPTKFMRREIRKASTGDPRQRPRCNCWKSFLMLHCANILAVWNRRQVLSRHDSEIGSDPASLDVVNDQRGCPTYVGGSGAERSSSYAARTPAELCTLTNTGDCSWFEFAREIVKGAGLATEVRPVSSATDGASGAASSLFRSFANKPADNTASKCPRWKDALRRYLNENEAV